MQAGDAGGLDSCGSCREGEKYWNTIHMLKASKAYRICWEVKCMV